MTPRSVPFWYDRFPTRRRPSFPRFRTTTPLEARVVIVGGGLTGIACAGNLAAARIPAVLIEADRVGAGATAGSAGLVREDFDASFADAAAAHGLRASRALWEGMRRASLEFPAALRRLGVKCDLEPQDLLALASPDRDALRQLRREYDARRAAGIEHRWVTAASLRRDAAIERPAAIRTRNLVLDPYRACLGLANAAVQRGARIFERTPVLRIKTARKWVEVVTAGGVVKADVVIVATGAPIPELRPLRRHLHPRHGYGVVTESLPAAVRREAGPRRTALRDSSIPPRFVRWAKEDRVLIEGADQDPVPARALNQALIQRTGQLMYELSLLYPAISGTRPEWAWSFGFDDTVDGLPYIGPHRNFPRHLFALGLGRHGVAVAWLAARLLTRQVVGEPAKWDEAFGFSRVL